MKKIQYAKSGRFVSVREAERRLKCAERLQEMRKKASEEYRRRKEENMKEEIDAMASKLARQAEEQAMKLLKTAFEDTDTDKSGTICAREIKQLFEKAGLHDTTDAEIKDMIKKCDKNNDSVLSFDEIAEGIKTSPFLHNVLSLRGQFLMVDTDKSGWISIDEHIAAINGMGNPWNFTEDHMKEIFNSMDANGDGKVSFEELIKAYCVRK